MSLFFINRPIKQGRPPAMFYFVRPRARAILPSVSFPPVLAASRLFRHVPFSSLSRIRFFRVFVRPLGRLTPFPGAKPPAPRSRRRRTLCRAGPPSGSLFAILFNFFAREESFYYLGARLQCLADNKPMKATFEPEGPLKSPFSRTSRFSLSLAHFHFLSFSHQVSAISFPLPVDPVPLPSRFASSNTAM